MRREADDALRRPHQFDAIAGVVGRGDRLRPRAERDA